MFLYIYVIRIECTFNNFLWSFEEDPLASSNEQRSFAKSAQDDKQVSAQDDKQESAQDDDDVLLQDNNEALAQDDKQVSV